MRRLGVMLVACVASTALAAVLTAWLTTQAYWGHGLASPSADQTAARIVAVDRYSDYAWDGTATSGPAAQADAARWENGGLGESPWGRLPAALLRRGLRPAKDDPVPPATLDAVRELLAAEGHPVTKVRAHLVEGRGADGRPVVLAAVFGPELSNDHYPYYEVAAAVEPDGRLRPLRVTHYRFDVAGLEGGAPLLAAAPVVVVFLFGWGCAFLCQLAGAFDRRPRGAPDRGGSGYCPIPRGESPMPQVRCPYCHEYIDQAKYPAHEARHLKARPDGQQTDYATLPEDEREAGDLAGVPRVYVHRKCGGATEMPEEIIRTYLKNPYMYMADETFCTGCGKHVPFRECEWEETGEDLQTYMDRLRAARPEMKPKGCLAAAVLLAVGLSAAAVPW